MLFAGLALLGLSGSARAEAPPLKRATVVQFRLPNGLDVILEENHRQPRVAVLVSYDIGWRDDPPGLAGLSHLVEHLTFRSSRHLPHDYEASSLLQRAGATQLNGVTTPDFTVYQAIVPSDALPLALFVESERMAFSLERFSEKTLRLERDIIWREQELGHRSARSTLAQDSLNAFFGEQHPYFLDSSAPSQLDDADLPAVQAFFEQTYRPDNAHLVIVGDLDAARTRALVEQYFGPIVVPGVSRRPAVHAPAPKPARSFVRRMHTMRDELTVTWAAPDPYTDAGLASSLLVLDLARELPEALVDNTGAATRVDTLLLPFGLGSLLQAHIAARSDLGSTARIFGTALHKVWKTDWAQRLPSLQRTQLMHDRVRRESLLQVAADHLRCVNARHAAFDFEAYAQRLTRITPAQMQALSTWFSDDKAMLGWLLRVGDTPRERVAAQLTVVPR